MIGGALGTGLRLWLSTLLALKYGGTFPLGTLAVNVIGSFVISLFAGLASADGPIPVPPLAKQVVMTGVLGGFTTFSSFSLETLMLINNHQWARAGANVGLSLALCLLAVWLGQIAAQGITNR